MSNRLTLRRTTRAAAPIAGLLVAGLLAYSASTAAFTAITTSPGNAWEAGEVTLTSNTGPGNAYVVNGLARFTASGITPGDQQQRCITVRSDGGIAGDLRFHVANVTGNGLEDRLRIRVQRATLPSGVGPGTTIPPGCAGYPAATDVTVHNVFLENLPNAWGTAPVGVSLPSGVTSNVVYRVRWRFVSTGSNAGDNVYQGTSAAADLVWELR